MRERPEDTCDQKLGDPEKFYKTPELILSDSQLTQAQKDRLLHCWEQDLLAMMRAEGENMMPKTIASQTAETLEKVKEAEKIVEGAMENGSVS